MSETTDHVPTATSTGCPECDKNLLDEVRAIIAKWQPYFGVINAARIDVVLSAVRSVDAAGAYAMTIRDDGEDIHHYVMVIDPAADVLALTDDLADEGIGILPSLEHIVIHELVHVMHGENADDNATSVIEYLAEMVAANVQRYRKLESGERAPG